MKRNMTIYCDNQSVTIVGLVPGEVVTVPCHHLSIQAKFKFDSIKLTDVFDAIVNGIATMGPRCSFVDNETTIVARSGIKRISIDFEDDIEPPIFLSKGDLDDDRPIN